VEPQRLAVGDFVLVQLFTASNSRPMDLLDSDLLIDLRRSVSGDCLTRSLPHERVASETKRDGQLRT
jgi:hypothetical protein